MILESELKQKSIQNSKENKEIMPFVVGYVISKYASAKRK